MSRIHQTRIELDSYDRIAVERAREILAEAKTVDTGDTVAICRALGRLEAITGAVLDIIDHAHGQEPTQP